MYYEDKLINGKLMCRTKPGGEWHPVVGTTNNLVITKGESHEAEEACTS